MSCADDRQYRTSPAALVDVRPIEAGGGGADFLGVLVDRSAETVIYQVYGHLSQPTGPLMGVFVREARDGEEA